MHYCFILWQQRNQSLAILISYCGHLSHLCLIVIQRCQLLVPTALTTPSASFLMLHKFARQIANGDISALMQLPDPAPFEGFVISVQDTL